MKTIILIECRACNGCYFGGEQKVILYPGDETKQPDEVYILTRKVPKCTICKERVDRTHGNKGRKFGM